MSKIGNWLIELEQNGEVYYDEQQQRYIADRERPSTGRLPNEAGEPAGEHCGSAQTDAGGTKLLPLD